MNGKFVLLFSLFFLLLALPTQAQLVLQIETAGKVKPKKYYIGDELHYRLKEVDSWEHGTIENLLYEESIIVLNDGYTELNQIDVIRSYQPQSWSRPMAYSLYTFAGSWGLFSVGASIFDPNDPLSWGDATVVGTSLAAGFLIQQLFKKKDYRLGKNRRLRILDLRVFPGN